MIDKHRTELAILKALGINDPGVTKVVLTLEYDKIPEVEITRYVHLIGTEETQSQVFELTLKEPNDSIR